MENTIIIDATDAILGRLASFAAKQALLGKKVIIVNSEKAKIIGDPKVILERYLKKRSLGRGTQKGPIISRKPEQILRRAIRGMIGRKKATGREAFKRVKCYEGTPEQFADKEKIHIETKPAIKFLTLGQLSKLLGYKK